MTWLWWLCGAILLLAAGLYVGMATGVIGEGTRLRYVGVRLVKWVSAPVAVTWIVLTALLLHKKTDSDPVIRKVRKDLRRRNDRREIQYNSAEMLRASKAEERGKAVALEVTANNKLRFIEASAQVATIEDAEALWEEDSGRGGFEYDMDDP